MITNFSWLIPGTLAGFGLLSHPEMSELEALKAGGIGSLVSLTEEPMDARAVNEAGLRYAHLPIPDMHAPSPTEIQQFVTLVESARKEGLATAVHCLAGLGRTGTMLAGYLVHDGQPWDRALETVRLHRPGSVETVAQEQAVREFARMLDPQGQRV